MKESTSQVVNKLSVIIILVASCGDDYEQRVLGAFNLSGTQTRLCSLIVDDFTLQALIMFSFVVKAMSIRVCYLSVTLVGSLTNCGKLRLEQKLDKA